MNPHAVKVELAKYEMSMAAGVAMRRQIDAVYAGRVDTVNTKSFSEGMSAHLLGSIGELSVAKALGIYWSGGVNTFRNEADIAHDVEVRHRSSHSWDLIIRTEDLDKKYYVLSTGDGPGIIVHGYIQGLLAKDVRWVRTYGGKRPAYFVPSDELRDINELRQLLHGKSSR